MLDVSASNLELECRTAEKVKDGHLRRRQDIIDRFVGPDYRHGRMAESDYDVEQRIYEYLTLMIPKMAYENPRAIVKSRASAREARIVAASIRHGLNRWIREQRLREPLQLILADCFTGLGASAVFQTHRPGYDPKHPSAPQMPQMIHLSPERIIYDPRTNCFDQARFTGHKAVRDQEDLLEDASERGSGWNREAIRSMATDDSHDMSRELGRPREAGIMHPPRGEVIFYEVFVPEAEAEDLGPDEGYNGAIYTIASKRDRHTDEHHSAYLRKPRAHYGPPWGPVQLYGVYSVPGDPFPLSPLVATFARNEELNNYARAVNTNAAQYKRIVLVPSGNQDLADKLRNEPNNFVVPVKNLSPDSQPIVIELGGVTDQHLTWLQVLTERSDRALSMDDAQRGNVTGQGSATEIAVADNASTVRVAYMKQQFARGVRQALTTAAWHMYHNEQIIFPLGQDEMAELREEFPEQYGNEEGNPWFLGGRFERDSGFTFWDTEIEVDIASMERSNETLEQQRALQFIQMMVELAPIMLQTPFIRWNDVLSDVADRMNIPEAQDYIDQEVYKLFSQAPVDEQTNPRLAAFAGGIQAGQSQQPAPQQAQPQNATQQLPAMQQARERGAQAASATMVR